ncbi:MAG: DUF86 domain-containing protein [Bacteroidaceae bacterium]|nr:DUF86 domain-containing protein [Bacteroidaceae bacterium]
MERHLKAHLYDISSAIDEIQSFFNQVPRHFDEYCKNLMLRRAVERNISIIGEAVNKIIKDNPNIKISNARAIIATRNRVIHDYAAVTDDVMWKIVINDLPKLKIEVDTLLAE